MIKARFPSRQEVLPVFAIFAFFGFSWAFYRMFWYVPSWLEYLNVWKVLTIASYVLAFALVESLLMLVPVILISLVFPARIFKDKFVVQGSSLAVLISIGAVTLQRRINLVYRLELWQIIAYSLACLGALVLVILALSALCERVPAFKRIVQTAAERMTVFAYVYVPLSLVGLGVVIIRNIISF
jgi:hypothetical protein